MKRYKKSDIENKAKMPKIVFKNKADYEKVKSIAGGEYLGGIVESNKIMVRGAIVGLIGGLAVAMFFKKSYIFCGIVGVIAGGFFAQNVIYKFTKKLEENLNSNNNNINQENNESGIGTNAEQNL